MQLGKDKDNGDIQTDQILMRTEIVYAPKVN